MKESTILKITQTEYWKLRGYHSSESLGGSSSNRTGKWYRIWCEGRCFNLWSGDFDIWYGIEEVYEYGTPSKPSREDVEWLLENRDLIRNEES